VEEYEEKVGFCPRNKAKVADFEVHLKSPAHRQFLENRKHQASELDTRSILGNLGQGHI
jgi:hypothetical protein